MANIHMCEAGRQCSRALLSWAASSRVNNKRTLRASMDVLNTRALPFPWFSHSLLPFGNSAYPVWLGAKPGWGQVQPFVEPSYPRKWKGTCSYQNGLHAFISS
jgi:hypothetical protein